MDTSLVEDPTKPTVEQNVIISFHLFSLIMLGPRDHLEIPLHLSPSSKSALLIQVDTFKDHRNSLQLVNHL